MGDAWDVILGVRPPNGRSVSDVFPERRYSLNTATWSFDRSLPVQTQGMGEMYAGRCPFYLIELPEGLVAFDSGIGRELVDDPASYGPYEAAGIADFMSAVDPDAGKRPGAPSRNSATRPATSTTLSSHTRVDHAGNIDRLDDAEVVIHHDEAERAKIPDGGLA